MQEVARLVPTKSDAELAEEYKAKIVEAYQPLLKVMDDLTADGFEANVSAGKDALGKMVINQLKIVKVY